MKKDLISYLSENGLRFHHISSTFEDEQKEFLSPESHYMCELFLLRSGIAYYFIDGKTYKISPMDLLIIPPHKIHSIQFDNAQQCERFALLFSIDLLPSLKDLDLADVFNPPNTYAHHIPAAYVKRFPVLQLFEECKNICKQKNIYTDLQFCDKILKIAECIHKIKVLVNEDSTFTPPIIQTTKISSLCIEYINQHLNEPLSLEYLEKALHISASHIRQTFKKEIGLTVHKYVLVQKMQLAHRLLSQGHPPVSVAEQLGYEYYSTFYENYVSYFHQSPKVNSNLAHQRLFVED